MILLLALLLQSTVEPGDWVELRRAMGPNIPSCTVRVYADGRVVWPGDAETRVSAADAQALIDEYRAKGFWDLQPDHRRRFMDNYSWRAWTTVHIGADQKSVADDSTASKWLEEMNRKLDELVDTHRWRHGDPRTERFTTREGHFQDNIHQDGRDWPKPSFTALMNAVNMGKVEEMEVLIRSGVDVNARDASGWTALMCAAADLYGEQGTRKLSVLLRAGADPWARSNVGQTVLMAVSGIRVAEPVRALVAAGADLNAQDDRGETALIDAVHRYDWQAVDKIQALLDAGARTDIRDRTGHTALEELQAMEDGMDANARQKALELLTKAR